MTDRATELTEILHKYAAIDPSPIYWMGSGEDWDADQAPSYCIMCAEKAVAEGLGASVDGGYGNGGDDSCVHCETCGAVLDYSLTETGVAQEIGHFSENPPTAPLDPDSAYHIARMTLAVQDGRNAELAADVLSIAEAAVQAIPQGRQP